MAPSPRRIVRKGQTRKDAAMDAMRGYGFQDTIVKDALNELLNVYGDEAWFFIEDCSYKELLEKILEKLNGEEEEEEATCNTAHSPVPEQSAAAFQVNPTRKRFHGWISNDDVHPSDIVTLERAPLPEKLQKILNKAKANNCMPSWAVMLP